jgi:hypothetical protein
MKDKINSATRLFKIFNEASNIGANFQIIQVWAQVFDVSDNKKSLKALKVSSYLNELSLETQLLREKLKESELPEIEYGLELDNIEEAISPLNFQSSWSSSGQYLTEGTLTSLKYWGYMLPTEQAFIPESHLTELLSLLDELEAMSIDSTFPLKLKETIKHQIQIIREAIAKYPIVGIKALRQAASSVYGEMTLVKDELANDQNKETTSKLKKIWELLLTTLDTGEKIDKAISLTSKAIEFFNKIS